jgi:hypothetical protein
MANAKPRNSCRSPFTRSEILPHPCEYIFSLMSFAVNKYCQTNSATYNDISRNMEQLHRPFANLPRFKKKTLFWHQNIQQFIIKSLMNKKA